MFPTSRRQRAPSWIRLHRQLGHNCREREADAVDRKVSHRAWCRLCLVHGRQTLYSFGVLLLIALRHALDVDDSSCRPVSSPVKIRSIGP